MLGALGYDNDMKYALVVMHIFLPAIFLLYLIISKRAKKF